MCKQGKFVSRPQNGAFGEIHGLGGVYDRKERDGTCRSGGQGEARPHVSYSRRTLGIIFRVQRVCVYPKPAKDVSLVRLANMQLGSHDVCTRRRREDSRLVKDVGSVGNLSDGREGADDDDEAG